MDWNSQVKKIGNIFNAIVSVATEVRVVAGRLNELVDQAKRIADNVSAVDSALGSVSNAINRNMGDSLVDALKTHEQIEGLLDRNGVQRNPPYKLVDVMGQMCVQLHVSHEKVDALVDRLGNQFNNEVLAVLQQENAKLEADNCELKKSVESFKELLDAELAAKKEREDGSSESD